MPIPNAPSGLTAAASGSGRIDLFWVDNSSNEERFEVEFKIGAGGTWAYLHFVDPDIVRYYDYSVRPSQQRYYRVRAWNASGFSTYSNEANATTSSAGAPTASLSLPSTAFTDESVIVDALASTNVSPRPQEDGTPSVIITTGESADTMLTTELRKFGYVWTNPGTYTVNVTVKNASGASASTSGNITISDIPAATGGNIRTATEQGSPAANYTHVQGLINDAAAANTVEQEVIVPASMVLTGEIELPTPTGSKYITIKSANLSSMPHNKRVGSADSANMPTFQVKTADGVGALAMSTTRPAPASPPHHYRVQGLHFKRDTDANFVSRLVYAGSGEGLAGPSELAHHLIFDRNWHDAGVCDPMHARVGVDIAANYVTVKDSYLGNFVHLSSNPVNQVDTSAISFSAGIGPAAIINNTLVAGSENFSISGSCMAQTATVTNPTLTSVTVSSVQDMTVDDSIAFHVGGVYAPWHSSHVESISGNNVTLREPLPAVPDTPGQAQWAKSPGYLLFRRNYLYKPLSWSVVHPSWDGRFWQIKNIWESKCSRWSIIDGNVVKDGFHDEQPYTNFIFSLSGNQFGCNSDAAEMREIQLSNNLSRDFSAGIFMNGHQNGLPISAKAQGFYIRNNLWWKIGYYTAGGAGSTPYIFASVSARDLSRVYFLHNTHDNNGQVGTDNGGYITDWSTIEDGGVLGGNMMWKNCIHQHGLYGYKSDAGGVSNALLTIQTYLPPGDTTVWDKNLIHNAGGTYPATGIYTTGAFPDQFVDYANGDFTLDAASDGKGTATDGTDVGVNMVALKTAVGAPTTAFGTVWNSIKAVTGDWTGSVGPQPMVVGKFGTSGRVSF